MYDYKDHLDENDPVLDHISDDNPVVTITVKDFGVMRLQLFPDVAENTVNNMINLIETGYYDGLGFHRVIEGFMIQGGWGDPTGCPIEGEFNANGVPNPLKHSRGVLSMARTNDPNSATGQFFIVHNESSHLDGHYAAYGFLVEGYEVLDAIADVATGPGDRPTDSVVMESVTVKTNGHTPSDTVCYGD